MSEFDGLVVMRLADMTRVHPRQDESRVCSHCGERVGIYPAGQDALKRMPALKIICQVCAPATGDTRRPTINTMVPGALNDIKESRNRDE